MAIIQGMCDSFRVDVLKGVHNLSTDTIKIALYYDTANLSNLTTAYTATGEIADAGYVAGGSTLVAPAGGSVVGQVGLAYVQWNNPSWTFTGSPGVRGALWYNASKSNKAILVLDFGTQQFKNNISNVFTVNFGPYPALNSALRLA